MEDKDIFQKGDKVFDINHGWGVIESILSGKICVLYSMSENISISRIYTPEGKYTFKSKVKYLSYKEYSLGKGGFSQKRPIKIPTEGTLVYVMDPFTGQWYMRHSAGQYSKLSKGSLGCYTDQKSHSIITYWSIWQIDNPLEK